MKRGLVNIERLHPEQILKLHEELPVDLFEAASLLEIFVIVAGTDIEKRKRVYPIGQEGFKAVLVVEIIILHNNPQKQLAGELKIDPCPQDITVEYNLVIIGVFKLGILKAGPDNEP